jgi:hypothetical protein
MVTRMVTRMAALRDRVVEQLPACGSDQPGLRATSGKTLVHGKEYLCVLKDSVCFASEQLNSITTALAKTTQNPQRLTTELSKPRACFTESGIRHKIERRLAGSFVREVPHYSLAQHNNR